MSNGIGGVRCPYCFAVDGHTMKCPRAVGTRQKHIPSPIDQQRAWQTWNNNVNNGRRLCANCKGSGYQSDGFYCTECDATGVDQSGG